MTTIREVVQLPDAHIQPLVHPLDIWEARKAFAVWWWLTWLVHPTVFLALFAALWHLNRTFVIPLLAPTTVLACAVLARAYYAREAWAFIPRKRQDVTRPLPAAWVLFGSLLHALLLGAVLLWGVWWLMDTDLPSGVAAYAVGTGLAVAVLMLVAFLRKIVSVARGFERSRQLAYDLPSIAVVVGTALYAYQVLSLHYGSAQWRMVDVLAGAAILITVQLFWWAIHTRVAKPPGEHDVTCIER
jgi:hypothetical protein